MAAEPSLPTLLSQVLIAFTIEFDNEFEHLMPHRTAHTPAAARGAPWLVSMAMWSNFMRFVDADGVALRDVAGMARITNLPGMQRWGYVTIEPDPSDVRASPPRADWVVRPTRMGRQAQTVWRPLEAGIEQRWRVRFGAAQVGALRDSLRRVHGKLGLDLPRYLPVLSYGDGMFAGHALGHAQPAAGEGDADAAGLELSTLLSRVLLGFTLEYERDSELSLAMGADVVRVLDGDGVRRRDLPRLAGVSKEAISAALGFLERTGHVRVGPDPGAVRTRVVRLTARGQRAERAHRDLLRAVEQRWRDRFGAADLDRLRGCLSALLERGDGERSRLSEGLAPYPDGWRARTPSLAHTEAVLADPAAALAHYPLVLHRGGYPDGS